MQDDRGSWPLVLSHHSLRHACMRDRFRAAQTAGLDGIGLNLRSYRRWRDAGHDDTELDDLIRRHDQQLVELEALQGWAGSAEQRRRAADREAMAFHLADRFGASYLQAIGPFGGDLASAARAFAALCDRARPHGLTVGLEFLPFTNIPDVATAATIVERADRDNGGVCVDAWHFFRGRSDVVALAAVPGDRIANVQLNDGSLEPELDDYLADCLANRRCPGDGEFPLDHFLRTIRSTGFDAPLSIEVISDRLDHLTPSEAAIQMADATRRVLTSTTAQDAG